jgi:osmoprotectant transport system substrate-binding protein
MMVAAALALVGAGCGSDDDSSSSTAPATSASTAAATSTPATTETSAAAGGRIQSNPANESISMTVGSKNFTEQKILGEIYAEALEAAGYDVDTELNLGDEKTALKALKDGQIDAYPEYTGTALLSFFQVPTDELEGVDSQKAYEMVKTDFAKEGIDALPPTPFTNSNEVAVTADTAQKLGLKSISDLKGKSQDLTLYGTPECRQRRDCLLGLEQTYGLKFKKFVPVDPALRHEVLEKGQADVSIVFTTDPQIKRDGEVLLSDDKHIFPPYNSTFLVKQDFVEKAGPDLQKTIELVNQGLTAPAIQELIARVDLDKQTPEDVAEQYLKESGYIS